MQNKQPGIVSLVPSLTELLIDLCLKDNLRGRTRFCVEPTEKVSDIPIVGGTKNPDIEHIKNQHPDLVIANKEENRKEDIEALESFCEVYLSDIASIEDALITINELGKKLNVADRATQITREIMHLLDEQPNEQPLQTAYFIWKDPWMTVGKDTYIHDVMQRWNLTNVFGYKKRYPQVTFEHIDYLEPELILLSSEPYPFKEEHVKIVEEKYDKARVILVDGRWFSWYGSGMIDSFKQLNTWRKAIS